MSDTPRTDRNFIGMQIVPASFAQQLERELNAANEHIKRLETTGDAMSMGCKWLKLIDRWYEAKNQKP